MQTVILNLFFFSFQSTSQAHQWWHCWYRWCYLRLSHWLGKDEVAKSETRAAGLQEHVSICSRLVTLERHCVHRWLLLFLTNPTVTQAGYRDRCLDLGNRPSSPQWHSTLVSCPPSNACWHLLPLPDFLSRDQSSLSNLVFSKLDLNGYSQSSSIFPVAGWTALSKQFDRRATLACTEVRFLHVQVWFAICVESRAGG